MKGENKEMENVKKLMARLTRSVPLDIQTEVVLKGKKFGLVIVDEIDGFCKPNAGALAPPAPDDDIQAMIEYTDDLARKFVDNDLSVLVLQDCHKGMPEPPYPSHCEEGSGEEELVEELRWLVIQKKDGNSKITIIKKDCINGFVGAVAADGRNEVVDWVNRNDIGVIVVVGICTDICVMQFVQTMLSARNHGMTLSLKDVVVYASACATYSLPREVAKEIGLPETLAHPRELTNYMGLYFMQMSGAILAEEVVIE